MYTYLIMLYFDVRTGVDKVDVDRLASWCQQRTRVLVWVASWNQVTVVMTRKRDWMTNQRKG